MIDDPVLSGSLQIHHDKYALWYHIDLFCEEFNIFLQLHNITYASVLSFGLSEVTGSEGCTMTQAQHNQAFFERASSTKPKATFGVNEHHDGGYELVSSKYAMLQTGSGTLSFSLLTFFKQWSNIKLQ